MSKKSYDLQISKMAPLLFAVARPMQPKACPGLCKRKESSSDPCQNKGRASLIYPGFDGPQRECITCQSYGRDSGFASVRKPQVQDLTKANPHAFSQGRMFHWREVTADLGQTGRSHQSYASKSNLPKTLTWLTGITKSGGKFLAFPMISRGFFVSNINSKVQAAVLLDHFFKGPRWMLHASTPSNKSANVQVSLVKSGIHKTNTSSKVQNQKVFHLFLMRDL